MSYFQLSTTDYQLSRRRRGVSVWPAVAFLCGAGVLIVFVSFYYLLPATAAAAGADQAGRKSLAAHSALLLAVLLVILFCGLLLTFRVGRMFLPRKTGPRTKTKYVDAWAEAGRRLGDSIDKDKLG